MADLQAAGAACDNAVTQGTNNKEQIRSWKRWLEYLTSIGLGDDVFLDELTRSQRHRILSAFIQAIRDARFSAERFSVLKAPQCRSAMDNVAKTFRANDRPDPRHDSDGGLAYVLQRQLKGLENADPGPIQQYAITTGVLLTVLKCSLTHVDVAMATLLCGAFFFAMRSCEYSKVSGERRTKIIKVGNVRFFLKKKELHHTDPRLPLADCVTIHFEFQKNDERNENVTHQRNSHPSMCPVRLWAAIVQRIRGYKGTTDDTTVNTVMLPNGQLSELKASDLLIKLRAAVSVLGKDHLGFGPNDIGLHSLRSGAAMAMYLLAVPVFTIMLLGRWSSDAFLRYIRRQVQQFSKGVSEKMVANEDFFTIPEINAEDPRITGHHLNHQMRNNCGPSASSHAMMPRMALFA
jgi:hypothetical protein